MFFYTVNSTVTTRDGRTINTSGSRGVHPWGRSVTTSEEYFRNLLRDNTVDTPNGYGETAVYKFLAKKEVL